MSGHRPVLFAFGLHLHQPVGNLDHVFQQHLDEVYRPLLRALEGGILPVTLHVSGPLLEWLENRASGWLDELGRLVADGRVELLLSGHDEPILAVLDREDRLDQIGRMREVLTGRFGSDATRGGLWLTERVWEPDLPADLVDAGVRYVLVDDRHFLVGGWERAQLHLPFRTEAQGRSLAVFPIDERLRYLVPFRPAEEFSEYIDELAREGHRLAVLADDGEKFGGWPGTREWVYEKGWLASWTGTLRALQDAQRLELVTFGQALDRLPPGGLAYLPSGAYREMEGWALPTAAGLRLRRLEHDLGQRMEGPDGALIRGTHWRHFLVKYPEANAMHKKAQTLSRMCRERGDPPEARRAIGRAQCNDAYWHGVFGGLYLPHLRHAVWRSLAIAEGLLRKGEPLGGEFRDVDADGNEELWVHSAECSIVISPVRGGRIEEYIRFPDERNYAAVLTRRHEAYHVAAGSPETGSTPGTGEGGPPSIHDLEELVEFEQLPPLDLEARAFLTEYVLPGDASRESGPAPDAAPLRRWAQSPFEVTTMPRDGLLRCRLCGPGLDKDIAVRADGSLEVGYRWDTAGLDPGAWFVAEISSGFPLRHEAPEAATWNYPLQTTIKSERGPERTTQGRAMAAAWPIGRGSAMLRIRPEPGEP